MASTPHADIRQSDGPSDRRWIVLLPDGSLITLGRARDPTDAELADVEAALARRGQAGWLAVQSHSIYVQPFPTFLAVRPIGEPLGSFDDAVAALRSRHARGG